MSNDKAPKPATKVTKAVDARAKDDRKYAVTVMNHKANPRSN